MFELNSPEHKAYAWGCEEGEQAERARIIALPLAHEMWGGQHSYDCITCYNIKIIKGETDE